MSVRFKIPQLRLVIHHSLRSVEVSSSGLFVVTTDLISPKDFIGKSQLQHSAQMPNVSHPQGSPLGSSTGVPRNP